MSVRHALLGLLSEGPKYGHQLRQEFEARTGDVWALNVGQVYTTLQRLERDGLVESDDEAPDGPQKAFRITAEGRDELGHWLRTPPDLTTPPATSSSSRSWWRWPSPTSTCTTSCSRTGATWSSSCSSGHGSRKTKPSSTCPLPSWSTPNWDGSTR